MRQFAVLLLYMSLGLLPVPLLTARAAQWPTPGFLGKFLQKAGHQPEALEIMFRVLGEPGSAHGPDGVILSQLLEEPARCSSLLGGAKNALLLRFVANLALDENHSLLEELELRTRDDSHNALAIDISLGSGTIRFWQGGTTFRVAREDIWHGWSPFVRNFLGFAPPVDESPQATVSPSAPRTSRGRAQTRALTDEEREASALPIYPEELSKDMDELDLQYGQLLATRQRPAAQILLFYMRVFNKIAQWARTNEDSRGSDSQSVRHILRGRVLPFDDEAFPEAMRSTDAIQSVYRAYDRNRDWI